MGAFTSIEAPLSNFLPFWMAFPPLIVILFSMALLGFNDSSIIFAILVSTAPYGIVNVWKGTKDIDPNLLEMASVFGSSQTAVWRKIYFPAVLPYLFSTGRYLFSMVWKLTLLAEVFGVSMGIGAQVRFWFDQANLTLLLAYFVIFFVTIVIIEYGVIVQLEKRAFKWRPEADSAI
jgi:NitT/TauT family transport system permease protein